MIETRATGDRFKLSGLLAGRFAEHQVPLAPGLRRAGLPPGFFQQEKLYANSFFRAFHGWEGASPGEWRIRHRKAEVSGLER